MLRKRLILGLLLFAGLLLLPVSMSQAQTTWYSSVVVLHAPDDPFQVQMVARNGYEFFAVLNSHKQVIVRRPLPVTHPATVSYGTTPSGLLSLTYTMSFPDDGCTPDGQIEVFDRVWVEGGGCTQPRPDVNCLIITCEEDIELDPPNVVKGDEYVEEVCCGDSPDPGCDPEC